MSEPLSKVLGFERVDYDGNICGEATPEIWKQQGYHNCLDDLDQRSPDAYKLAEMMWNYRYPDLFCNTGCELFRRCFDESKEIIKKMNEWVVKKG